MSLVPEQPLTDRTLRERRGMLGVATAAVALVQYELIPEKLPALGVEELTAAQREGLAALLFLALLYLSVMFVVYVVVDVFRWCAVVETADVEIQGELEGQRIVAGRLLKEDQGPLAKVGSKLYELKLESDIGAARLGARAEALKRAKQSRWMKWGRPASWVGIGFDVVLPLGWGVYALWRLGGWTPPC